MEKTSKTPLEDLRESDLKHYDEAATSVHCYRSELPKAINFYYDYKQMNFFGKIKLAFKQLKISLIKK